MTFKEWLSYACKNRTSDIRSLLPELKLNDGTELSVQASDYHMCFPQETLYNGDYENVEVYTHGIMVKGFEELKEISSFIYGYVDVDKMEEICEKHGGILIDV